MALASFGGNVLVGGTFSHAGGLLVNRIAQWNGTSWSALEADGAIGISGGVGALLSNGNLLYVAGSFTEVGGRPASRIAAWTGSSWLTLAGGAAMDVVPPSVAALTAIGDRVYAAGKFTSMGGVSAQNIASWDGATWSAVGSGFQSAETRAMGRWGDDLVVTGHFPVQGSPGSHGLARWDGKTWYPFGSGLRRSTDEGTGLALLYVDEALYVGGSFQMVDGVHVANAAVYRDQDKWSALSGPGRGVLVSNQGSDWERAALQPIFFRDHLYVAGVPTMAGSTAVNHIARWDGSDWYPLGEGLNGPVQALTVWNEVLIVAGDFDQAGGVSCPGIAAWNGNAWVPFAGAIGIDGADIRAMIGGAEELYVGGRFTHVAGVEVNSIAKWDSTEWSALGDGFADFASVTALALDSGALYAGGTFSRSGDVPLNRVAKWNGTSWSALGSGIGAEPFDSVRTLAVLEGHLFAGGEFAVAGGDPAENISVWDGAFWSTPGGCEEPAGMDDRVEALVVDGGEVYVVGRFQRAGGTAASNVARWVVDKGASVVDGRWHSLGGPNDYVIGAAAGGGRLVVTGQFTSVHQGVDTEVSVGIAAFVHDKLFAGDFERSDSEGSIKLGSAQ